MFGVWSSSWSSRVERSCKSRKPVTSVTCFVETCRGHPPVVIQGRTCAEQNAKLNRGFRIRAVVLVVEFKRSSGFVKSLAYRRWCFSTQDCVKTLLIILTCNNLIFWCGTFLQMARRNMLAVALIAIVAWVQWQWCLLDLLKTFFSICDKMAQEGICFCPD